MTDELPPTPGPRRYKVQFDCRADVVGAVFSLLIKEVQNPKMETVEDDTYRITLVCLMDQLPTIVGVIVENAIQLFVGPYKEEPKMAPAVFVKPREQRVITPLQKEITYLPAQRKRSPGEVSKARDTNMGKILLSVFSDGKRVKHHADFSEALTAAGYSHGGTGTTLSRLLQEGDLVRIGRGAYRLPSVQDQLQQMHERDPSFDPNGSSTA